MAYQSHTDMARLTWSDRRGTRIGEIGSPGNYQSVRLSPDGGRVLVDRIPPRIGSPDLWVLDLVRGGETRLTSDLTSESYPVWLRDGLGLVFMADRDGPPHLFRRNLVTGAEDALLPAGRIQRADDVSPNGKTLAFVQRTPLGNYDILTLSLDAPGEPSSCSARASMKWGCGFLRMAMRWRSSLTNRDDTRCTSRPFRL